MCPFDYTAAVVSGRVVRTYTGLTTPVGVTAVTPTDRPKSVRNHCVIEVFWWRFLCYHDSFWIFCGCKGFSHRTESDLFLFLLTGNAKEEIKYHRYV